MNEVATNKTFDIYDWDVLKTIPDYAKVRNHLERMGTITSVEAWSLYGITRLSAVIHELRHKFGMDIKTKMKSGKDRYGQSSHYGVYYYNVEDIDV